MSPASSPHACLELIKTACRRVGAKEMDRNVLLGRQGHLAIPGQPVATSRRQSASASFPQVGVESRAHLSELTLPSRVGAEVRESPSTHIDLDGMTCSRSPLLVSFCVFCFSFLLPFPSLCFPSH